MENSCYTSRKVIQINMSEMHSILVRVSKREMHVIPEVKKYVTLEVVKSKLTKLSKEV